MIHTIKYKQKSESFQIIRLSCNPNKFERVMKVFNIRYFQLIYTICFRFIWIHQWLQTHTLKLFLIQVPQYIPLNCIS